MMDVSALTDLCRLLDMPEDLTKRLAAHIPSLDFEKLSPWIDGLVSLETGAEAVKRIPELCKTEDDPTGDSGLKALTVYLIAAALRTKQIYDAKGIDGKIFADTMKALPRFAYEHYEGYGRYGFDRDFWIYRQLSARLFRLGALEFEMYRFPDNKKPAGLIAPGEDTLSVHIPSDAEMSRDELVSSYKMAVEFFARHFPDFKYRCFYCDSWLLSPALDKILKPGSRILNFRADYEIMGVDTEDNAGFDWIFKRKYDDLNQLPEDTSLRRGMKKILLDGGKTGSAEGFIAIYSFSDTKK